MSSRLATLLVAGAAMLASSPAWAIDCVPLKPPEAQAAGEQTLARLQQRTRHREPIDTSIVHLGREDIYSVLREIRQKEVFGFAPNVSDRVVMFAFNTGPVSARTPFIPTLVGNSWMCLLPVSIGVFLSDGFVWHVSQVYRLDPTEGMVWFADIWPDNFLLAEGRNALGIKARVKEENGTILHGVSIEDAQRVITGAIVVVSGESQMILPALVSSMTAGREKARVALQLGTQYRGAGSLVRAVMSRDLKALPEADRKSLDLGLDAAEALGADYAGFEDERQAPSKVCATAVPDIEKTVASGSAAVAAFPLLRIAGPVATYCRTDAASAALSRLAESLPEEVEASYWAARSNLAQGQQDQADRHLGAIEKWAAAETERMLDSKVGDKIAYLRTTPVDTPSYNFLRFWDREARRLRVVAEARKGGSSAARGLDELVANADWRDYSLASRIYANVPDVAFITAASAMWGAEGPVAGETARRVLRLYKAAPDSNRKREIAGRMQEVQAAAQSRGRVYEASLYDSLLPEPPANSRR